MSIIPCYLYYRGGRQTYTGTCTLYGMFVRARGSGASGDSGKWVIGLPDLIPKNVKPFSNHNFIVDENCILSGLGYSMCPTNQGLKLWLLLTSRQRGER